VFETHQTLLQHVLSARVNFPHYRARILHTFENVAHETIFFSSRAKKILMSSPSGEFSNGLHNFGSEFGAQV
jgi:hypothetical protein